ncbi:acylneuraminate cytidylyltransferase family protein [Candidatus Peregrinibacteria bacterium]|nr:acylneuraminate cytidylyltransferase family protein [Candidatus Peregrinibacteria bacterium]
MKPEGILGIITARGGSKRLPGKNIASVNGRPLLAYTCEAALGSALLTRTVLSTDDEAIAAVGRSCGIEVPFLRPKELARDDTPSTDVIAHMLSELEKKEKYYPTIIVLLQPTSPLRTSEHIDRGVRLLRQTGADSVVSVVEAPHALTPGKIMRVVDGKLRPAERQPGQSARAGSRAAETEKFYGCNGAIYAFKTAVFLRSGGIFGDDSRAMIMNPEDSLDIDSPFDLLLAEKLLQDRAA